MAATDHSRCDRILAASLAAGAAERAAFQVLLVEAQGRIDHEVLGRAVSHSSRPGRTSCPAFLFSARATRRA